MTEVDAEGAGAGADGSGGNGADRSGTEGGRRRWRWVVAASALLGGAGVVVGWLAVGDDSAGDDPTESSGPPSLPPPVAGDVDAEAEEFIELLDAGRALTYHATYEASGEPAVTGNELRVEVWHRDGRIRQDGRQATDSATVETIALLIGDAEPIACSRVDAADWHCSEQAESNLDIFRAVAGDLAAKDVTVMDTEIAGRAARCFTVPTDDGEITECLAEDGIPLRLSGPDTELVLVDLSNDVPDDVFTPPVAIGEP